MDMENIKRSDYRKELSEKALSKQQKKKDLR